MPDHSTLGIAIFIVAAMQLIFFWVMAIDQVRIQDQTAKAVLKFLKEEKFVSCKKCGETSSIFFAAETKQLSSLGESEVVPKYRP